MARLLLIKEREWFQRFKNGHFDSEVRHGDGREMISKDAELEVLLHEDSCQTQEELAGSMELTQQAIHGDGREMISKDAELEVLLHENSCQTQEELAGSMELTQQAILKRLKAVRMIQKQENWVLYDLKPRDVERSLFACEQLLERQRRKRFLHRIVTEDEKWIHYDNLKCRKSWGLPSHASTSTVKQNIHSSKIMFYIWCDQFGVVYYEMLKPSETITGDLHRK